MCMHKMLHLTGVPAQINYQSYIMKLQKKQASPTIWKNNKIQLNDSKQQCILSREKGALADQIPISIYLY